VDSAELDIADLFFATDEELAGVLGHTVTAETDAGQLLQHIDKGTEPGDRLWRYEREQTEANFWTQVAAMLPLVYSDSPISGLRPNLAQVPEVANVQQVPIPQPLRRAFVKNLPKLLGDHSPEAVVAMLGFPSFAMKNQANSENQRVTMWNPTERRKLSGNAAPFRRNLEEYITAHPEWQVYESQDQATSDGSPDIHPNRPRHREQECNSAAWSWPQEWATEPQPNPESTRQFVANMNMLPPTETVLRPGPGCSMSHFLPGQLACGPSEEAMEKLKRDNERVTIWNPSEGRKISGNAAPFRRNLKEYLQSHSEWEVYTDQGACQNKNKRKQIHSKESSTIPEPEAPQSKRAAVQAEAAQTTGEIASPVTFSDMPVHVKSTSAADDELQKQVRRKPSTSGAQIGQSQRLPIRRHQLVSQQPQVMSV